MSRRWVIMGLLVVGGFLSRACAEWTEESSRRIGTLPGSGVVSEVEFRKGDQLAKITSISFHERNLKLFVVENSVTSPQKLRELAPEHRAVAGINASYFHSSGEPLGLVVSGGRELHRQERARLLSGILAVRDGRIELVRASEYRGGRGVSEAIQAGPWLVEKGKPTSGLDDTKRARRSVFVKGPRGQWALVATSPLTLADAARILASRNSVPGLAVKEALNLDGGSSTAMWAAGTLGSDAVSIPEFGTVRNFLLLKPTP